MNVYVTIKTGENKPQVFTTARAAAKSIGISPMTIARNSEHYAGTKGNVWLIEVERSKRRGNPAFGKR